jgi:hypothetical protein
MKKKELIEHYRQLFTPYVNKPVTCELGKHSFDIVIVDVTVPKQVDVYSLPDKRINSAGKQYTPQLLQIITSGGETIDIVIEDIDKSYINSQGLFIDIGSTRIRFYEGIDANKPITVTG